MAQQAGKNVRAVGPRSVRRHALCAVTLTAAFLATVAVQAETFDPCVANTAGQISEATRLRPSFVRDVMPVLTKAGCNAGACHGSFQGRGGLQLSILGYDPAIDYDALFKAGRGRRVNLAAPALSLVLQKATNTVPHRGGQRFPVDSAAYEVLRAYLDAGAPPPQADALRLESLRAVPDRLTLPVDAQSPVQIVARWSDGAETDVTSWVAYDVRDSSLAEVSRTGVIHVLRPGKNAVTARLLGQVAAVDLTVPLAGESAAGSFVPQNYIDQLVSAEWQRIGLAPVELSSDAEFLRRVHLDLIGALPTVEETRRFLADAAPDKRSRLIDALLIRPEYVDHWAVKWGDLLRVHRRYVGDKGLAAFSGWLRRWLRENRPVTEPVRELLTSQGNVFQTGPVAFFFVDEKPEELAETTAQVFLGIRMQCTRCHHHPFEVWSQEDYYGLAAFFTRLEIKQPQESGSGGRFGGSRILRLTVKESPNRPLKMPARPKLLGDPREVEITENGDVRSVLADWITDPANPFFAKNIVNRYWAYMMGRGLVEGVDDHRSTNPPTNPALLDALSGDFVAHGFDLKHLLRTICNSQVYQLASRITPAADADDVFYSYRRARRLPAEVMLDSVNQACETQEAFTGLPVGTRASALPDPAVASRFLDNFGRPPRSNACECARGQQPDLSQALQMLNGLSVHQKVTSPEGRVARLLKEQRPDAEIIEELYLATLCRPPSSEERAEVAAALSEAPSRQEGIEDLLWALLNSAEFGFSH